jgi:hypothetical protein
MNNNTITNLEALNREMRKRIDILEQERDAVRAALTRANNKLAALGAEKEVEVETEGGEGEVEEDGGGMRMKLSATMSAAIVKFNTAAKAGGDVTALADELLRETGR